MLDKPGMIVLLVNSESPAWKAEFKVGDVLLTMDGDPVNKIEDYYRSIANKHGKKIKCTVERKGQELDLYVTFS